MCALGAWLTEQGLLLEPEDISTAQLRSFQAYLLTPEDKDGASARTSTVCTRHDALRLFFKFLEEEDDLPDPMRRVRRPTENEPVILPLTEDEPRRKLHRHNGYPRRPVAWIHLRASAPERSRRRNG